MALKSDLDKAYMRMAHEWAKLSYAERRQVGCLIAKDHQIISDGFNGTPTGFQNICEGEDGETLPHVLHAESNALTKLARSTQSSDGGTLYVTLSPCFECSKLIIQSGIDRVVCYETYSDTKGIDLLRTAGIKVDFITL
jgi:dCMP deaminase